jgi:CHRD domain
MKLLAALVLLAGALATPAPATATTFLATLDGPSEEPPVASPGTGSARVDLDLATHLLRVRFDFAGLIGTTAAAHIHGPTALPGEGIAGVMTAVPTFPGTPLGVTSGSYDATFDTRLASTYNPAFVTSVGSLAAAETAFAGILHEGRAYLNIHSSFAPGGEIRGFLAPIPLPGGLWLMLAGLAGLAALRRRAA